MSPVENQGRVDPPWRRHAWVLGLLPAVLYILVFFVGGMLQSLWVSLGTPSSLYGRGELGWPYRELANRDFLHPLGTTAGLAAAAAAIASLAGLAMVLFLIRRGARWRWLEIISQLPMGVPHLLAAHLLAQVFWQSGWFSRLAYHLGLIQTLEEFPVLIQDPWGIGVLLTYAWKEIPFMVLLLLPFAARILYRWEETATALGASFGQTVRWVVLPALAPLWLGGMWVVFAFVLGAYEVPALTAATAPGWVPVLAWQEYTEFGLPRRPVAMAMNLLLAALAFLVGLGLLALQRNWHLKGRRLT